MSDTVERYIDIHGDDVVEELSSLVSVPSVSAQRDHCVDVRRCCEYLVDRMTQSGLTARLVETSGHPVAFGRRFVGDHLPKVLVYCHYDVQPANQSEGWAAPPFEASVQNERVYGRGVSDDKGHIVAHLVAIKAILACRRELPVNLELLFEGEEEIGSPHFEQAIETELAGINPDVIVISDTPMYAADVPALTVSLRGIVVWEVTVSGSHDDLHSGLYGGIVQNPIDALARILTSLQDADGCIAVPGFYDGVEDVDPAYLADLRTLDYDEAVVSEQLGVPELRHDPTHAALECLWYRPTIDCNGIYGGYAGEGRKTIIPHCATAKLSSRLVQGQDPDRIASLVSRFIVENAPRGVRVDVTHEVGNPAVRAPIDHPAVAAAKRSVEAVFGRPAAFIGNGGSIGAASVFARRFSCPQIMLGFGLPTDAIHAPNEHVDVWRLVNGAKTIARFYDELAAR